MSDEKRARGRPALESIADFSHSGPKVAQEVFAAEAALGGKRGALARAIRQVAAERCMEVATVKKHAQRYAPEVRDIVINRHSQQARFSNLRPLLSGFPDDVLKLVGTLPLGRAMKFLEQHVSAGTCPAWLVECVRQHRGDPSELMQKLNDAAPRGS